MVLKKEYFYYAKVFALVINDNLFLPSMDFTHGLLTNSAIKLCCFTSTKAYVKLRYWNTILVIEDRNQRVQDNDPTTGEKGNTDGTVDKHTELKSQPKTNSEVVSKLMPVSEAC